MSKITEVGEDTVLGVSIKTLIALAIGLSVAVGMYYDVKGEIEIAKQLPEPAVSRTEFDLKDELVRSTIMSNAKNIEEMKKQLDKIENRYLKSDESLACSFVLALVFHLSTRR
jgi:polysaccharide pyruvyl transferase WcaK-like protein